MLKANRSLCLAQPGASGSSATLAPCGTAPTLLARGSDPANLVFTKTGDCLDLNTESGAVDTWACGSAQPNQAWAWDAATGLIVSESHYEGDPDRSVFAGECLTAV